MAQRLAALGPAVRGRKVAVVLSPTFFCVPWSRPRAYASNFSPLIAGECLFSPALSRSLRQRFAERLSLYPETLRKRPTLVDAAALLLRDSALAKVRTALLAPLGRAENLLYEFQDHAAAVSFLRKHEGELVVPARAARRIDWPAEQQRYAALAEPFPASHPSEAQKREFKALAASGGYRRAMLRSPEWQNFELLLETARALHVRLLVAAIPLNGVCFDELGVTREDRAFFYDHLETLCASHRAALRDFREWDEDAKFFRDRFDHITSEAWILIDQTLDNFYHDRPIGPLRGPVLQERPPAEEKSRVKERAKLS
jgi:D-alanine transfer protein